jgi:thiamine biosynthesis lipoprotein
VRNNSVKRLRISLGTLVAVEAASSCASAAETAVEAAFLALTEVDRRMHPQSADSDLARINNAPPGTAVTVHASTCELLDLARRLNALTDGIFDPCLPGRPGRLQDIEVSTEAASSTDATSWTDATRSADPAAAAATGLLRPSGAIRCHAPVALDFGGFAKGYAVDCAIDALMRHGCSSGLVNAGGDLRVFGPRVEPILLRGPAADLVEVPLTDAALAVSDADSSNTPAEHQGYYVRGVARSPLLVRYAAVTAKQAVIADALAKCVLLCPPEVAERALRAFDATRHHPARSQ